MKKIVILIGIVTLAGLTFVFAQTTNWMRSRVEWHSGDTAPHGPGLYDKKTPPLLSLAEAYSLAAKGLGADTNNYYCVHATCLERTPQASNIGIHGDQGWTFEFSNTNGDLRQVLVYFDRATWVQAGPEHRGAQF